MYRRGSGCNVLLVGVYVDDLMITGAEEVFKVQMKKAFDMSEVRQDATGIALHQTHYAKHILELGGMTGYNLAHTPMEERLKLSQDSTAEEVDPTHY